MSRLLDRPAHHLGVMLLVGAALFAAAVPAASAQRTPAADEARAEPGRVVGVVREAGGAPVVGAQVSVTPVRTAPTLTFGRSAVTGDDGQFRVAGMPDGGVTVAVRRIGYQPASVTTTVPAAGPVEVTLVALPAQLSTVIVRGGRHGPYTGFLADFNRRRDLAIGGRFFTAEDLDRRQAIYMTDILRMVPGLSIVRGRTGNVLRFRGNTCDPLVWIDGMAATTAYLDVDIFPPHSLAGVEVYSGIATVPVELRGMNGEGACGVIALWTRMPEPRARRPKHPVTAEQLAALVASASLYTADQVDRPATLDTTEALTVVYPDSLRRAAIPGSAVVEFVVDTAGRVEPETIGVVTASHPRFAEEARIAARGARFIPAQKAGQLVRQLTQLPLRWESNGSR